ncbi:TetR/AcrR family transcriptional regulator [Streptomyces sp. H28]|uniref:TetR/AcrR family transcriptional regulator n=1 Tax=Streptomyces sp. H28 TaxID=2775865 RepID=UPI00177E7687|nr:TetR/AcrR family transcriptional regulator [Streptomyces sp. H28]MBD9734007.1 TetR/AcrR family transcriptional regulator [Streptomyces sp. H28]
MAQVRPMRADARRNRERLLAAAVEAFASQGESASLDDIAKRAGVGSGTLYRHFPTRRALLEAVYADRIGALAARAGDLADRLPPGPALRAWLDELGAGMVRIRGLRALLGPAVGSGPGDGPGCCDPLLAAAELLAGAARRAGELRPDVEAVDVLRLVHGVAAASELADGDGGPLRRYVGLLVEGLAPRPRA